MISNRGAELVTVKRHQVDLEERGVPTRAGNVLPGADQRGAR